jgi:hypothetical protein
MDEDAVLLDLKDGEYYELNSVAARVWDLVSEPRTVAEILKIILDEFEVDEGECRGDIFGLLEELADKGLVGVDT